MVGERGAAWPLSETGTHNPPPETRKGENIWALDRLGGADTVDTQENTPMFQTLTHIIRSIQATLGIILGGARPQLLRIETGRSRRAVSFIEYALLAGAAVLLVTLLSSQLRGIIQDLLNNLRESILG